MKITIEDNNKEVDFNPADLFKYPESPIKQLQKPKKTHIKWRDARPGRKTQVVTQVIDDARIRYSNWEIDYYMAGGNPKVIDTYRVYDDVKTFITDAIEKGCLKRGVPYAITLETDENKAIRWIEIQEL